jgi:hypothetical protein
VIEALLDDVLDKSMVAEAIDEAVRLLQPEARPSREDSMRRELAQLETERARLVRAITLGGELEDLIEALRDRERRHQELKEQLRTCRSRPPMSTAEINHLRFTLTGLANGWSQILRDEPEHARPIISALLVGRVTFTPTGRRSWEPRGTGTLRGLFQKMVSAGGDSLSAGGTSPTGFEPVFWP